MIGRRAAHQPVDHLAADARLLEAFVVGRGGEWVDGRSVLSLLSLAASRGTRLCVRAVGPDARAAVEALGALIERSGLAD